MSVVVAAALPLTTAHHAPALSLSVAHPTAPSLFPLHPTPASLHRRFCAAVPPSSTSALLWLTTAAAHCDALSRSSVIVSLTHSHTPASAAAPSLPVTSSSPSSLCLSRYCLRWPLSSRPTSWQRSPAASLPQRSTGESRDGRWRTLQTQQQPVQTSTLTTPTTPTPPIPHRKSLHHHQPRPQTHLRLLCPCWSLPLTSAWR